MDLFSLPARIVWILLIQSLIPRVAGLFDLNRNSTLSASNVYVDKATSIIYYNKSTRTSTSTSVSSKSSVRLSKSDQDLSNSRSSNPLQKDSSSQRLTALQTARLFENLISKTKEKSSYPSFKLERSIGEGQTAKSPSRVKASARLKNFPRTVRRASKDPLVYPFEKELYKNSAKIREAERINQNRQSRRRPRQKCTFFKSPESSQVNLMAQSPNLPPEQIPHQRQNLPNELGLEFLMQHMQKSSLKNPGVFAQDSEDRKGFPFQATPSGNLKIIPNQVVYESKKVSVLVADPKNTRVNVKADLEKLGLEELNNQDSVELPPGVTVSTVNQLQVEQKLPRIPTIYRPRTQPYRPKPTTHPGEMEQKLTVQTAPHRLLPPAPEVPLSSLGFTVDQPIIWENISLPEKTDLYHELAKRITNYKNADCIVRLEEDEFHCHLIVLQSYSTFFDERNCKEIDLTGSSVTSRAFSLIYDWMINPSSDSCQLLRRDNILEIFVAAQYLGIKELEEQCWAFIDNDELFCEDTAFLLYLEARKIKNTAVMELMVPRIMKFFLMLVSTKDFLELSVEELCLLLKSNYICVNSEIEVLMSAVRWLMHDWEERKKHMLEVLRCIRFGLIAPWQLIDVKRNPENPEFMELMSYPEVQKMVDDGLAFVIIKYWYGNQTEDYYHWIDLLGLTEPTNRNWAGEDKNYVTYREFLLYLEEYRKTQLPEFKSRNLRSKESIDSPPKDCPSPPAARTRSILPQTFCNDRNSHGSTNVGNNTVPLRNFSKISGYQASNQTSGTILQAEMIEEYTSNVDRSSKGVSRSGSKSTK